MYDSILRDAISTFFTYTPSEMGLLEDAARQAGLTAVFTQTEISAIWESF